MTKVQIPGKYINSVRELLKVNRVRYLPFIKLVDEYEITILDEHPIISFLQLRYS